MIKKGKRTEDGKMKGVEKAGFEKYILYDQLSNNNSHKTEMTDSSCPQIKLKLRSELEVTTQN